MLMNGGTLIFSPVSRMAGLSCACAVAPLMLGSVSTTFSSTVAGNSRVSALPSWNVTLALLPSLRYSGRSPTMSAASVIWS
jgi:hypothetical protein